jgi:hypothetical protein
MKGNTRKLAVLGIITVIVPFILAACATTSPPVPHALQGQYVGSGVDTCLFAVCGFGDNNVPNYASGPNKVWGTGAWSLSTSSHSIVMTLEPDGTGTVSEDIHAIIFNNTSPTVPWPSTGEATDTHNIAYMVAPDGTFIFRDVPGTFKWQAVSGAMKGQAIVITGISGKGHISPDGKVITFLDTGAPHTFIPPVYMCPVPTEPKPEFATVCNATFTLFKQ